MPVRLMPIAACVVLISCLAACGQEQDRHARPATAAKPGSSLPAPAQARVEPCSLLTQAEVTAALPAAQAGRQERSDEPYGIRTCIWSTPEGELNLQVFDAGPGSVENEIRGLSFGLVDIRSKKAATAVRLEAIPGVGDQTIALVEKEDLERGIRKGNALIVSQVGTRLVVLRAAELADSDRKRALATLVGLAKAATGRL